MGGCWSAVQTSTMQQYTCKSYHVVFRRAFLSTFLSVSGSLSLSLSPSFWVAMSTRGFLSSESTTINIRFEMGEKTHTVAKLLNDFHVGEKFWFNLFGGRDKQEVNCTHANICWYKIIQIKHSSSQSRLSYKWSFHVMSFWLFFSNIKHAICCSTLFRNKHKSTRSCLSKIYLVDNDATAAVLPYGACQSSLDSFRFY